MGSSSLPEATDVFICGAGPAGLSAALSIKHYSPETSVAIVDALPARQNESRALVIHARTMEALRDIDASDAIEKGGIPAPILTIQNETSALLRLEPWRLHKWTSFPFILEISQWKTEAILTKLLEERKVKVLRPFRVVDMKPLEGESNPYKFVVNLEGGRTIKAKYVVGADGSKSAIRSSAGINYTQWPSETPLMKFISHVPEALTLADVKFTADTHPESLALEPTITFGKAGLLLLAPVEQASDDVKVLEERVSNKDSLVPFRMVFTLTPTELEHRHNESLVTLSFLQDRLNRLYRRPAIAHPYSSPSSPPPPATEIPRSHIPQIQSILWSSTFRIRYCLADQFTKQFPNGGYVVLVGDAAHIHSPAGGQGMNMGMCDGLEAGLAIATHIHTEEEEVMSRLDDHRRGIAKSTIAMTRFLGWFATFTGWKRVVRDWVLWSLGRSSWARRALAWQVSGLRFLYTA